MDKQQAIRLKDLYTLTNKLYELAKSALFLDEELFADVVELKTLVNTVVDNVEIYEKKELDEILDRLEETLKTYVQKLKQEVI